MADSKKPAKPGWGMCRAAIKNWPRPGVVALVKELYDLSEENRRFLHARLLPQHIGETVEQAKRTLRRMLSANTAFNGHFQHIEVKRFIDRFAKGCDDPAALGDLLLTDLEAGCATMGEIGDYPEMVDHVYATLQRLEKTLKLLPRESIVPLVERLNALAKKWGMEFGYGISDELVGFAAFWSGRVGGG
jgi:hypothetical protein